MNQSSPQEAYGNEIYNRESPDIDQGEISEVIQMQTDESYEQSDSKKDFQNPNLYNKNTTKFMVGNKGPIDPHEFQDTEIQNHSYDDSNEQKEPGEQEDLDEDQFSDVNFLESYKKVQQ